MSSLFEHAAKMQEKSEEKREIIFSNEIKGKTAREQKNNSLKCTHTRSYVSRVMRFKNGTKLLLSHEWGALCARKQIF